MQKLYRAVTCPTRLANLQVVSLNPFELEILLAGKRAPSPRNGSNSNSARKPKNDVEKRGMSDYFGGVDEDYDDYFLEQRLRHKLDREKRRRGNHL